MVNSSTSAHVSRNGGSRILPLDHPEPFAATLGVMLYPGTNDADKRKAKAFAAQYLAEPIRRLHEAGGTLDAGAILDGHCRRFDAAKEATHDNAKIAPLKPTQPGSAIANPTKTTSKPATG